MRPILIAALLLALTILPPANTVSAQQPKPADASKFAERLVKAAMARTTQTTIYDPSYQRLAYPGGDVANDRGVCTDVIIRSYRALGIDLQKLVHEDMRRAFRSYPRRWGLSRPDPNIDHRRVPNLQIFFIRKRAHLAISADPADYKPGDLVTWDLRVAGNRTSATLLPGKRKRPVFGGLPHIGIVATRRSSDGKRPLIIHNIGSGTEISDILFQFAITGHYRFHPAVKNRRG